MFFKQNADRRSFLGALGAAVGALATPFRLAGKSAPFTPPPANITGFGSTGNVYEELGVTTVINGEGTMTVLGGSLMRPEVEALMSLAGRHFVPMIELEVAAGQRIAQMMNFPRGIAPSSLPAQPPPCNQDWLEFSPGRTKSSSNNCRILLE